MTKHQVFRTDRDRKECRNKIQRLGFQPPQGIGAFIMVKITLQMSVLVEDEDNIDEILDGVEDWLQGERQSSTYVLENNIIKVEYFEDEEE